MIFQESIPGEPKVQTLKIRVMHSLTNTPRDSIQISNEKDKALHCSLGFFSKEVLTSTVVFSGTDLSFPIVQWSSEKGERIDARANSTLGENSLHICST